MGTDHDGMTYAEYLHLDRVLDAQYPRAEPEEHDELMFIIHHQVTELWFKLLLHEVAATRTAFRADAADWAALSRAARVLTHMNDQWRVLDTLTPEAFHRFRHALGSASGLFSVQYRALEYLLGKRHPGWNAVAATDADQPSVFDEFLRFLHRRGHPVPDRYLHRDWRDRRDTGPQLDRVLERICARGGDERLLCEELAAIDGLLREWRLRHLQLVERLLGGSPGTGGTAGVGYLKMTVDDLHFPELARFTCDPNA
ncbi:tryptophan 2,3-dioxygenase [Nocardia wallacei]|uniref:tryptophan 2,3-dioxygenase n=1 Tax=Nocardia wallacei TaxID=480035 RepID=UPI002453CC65|nr:tryptophan 2,3-dioxygenase family protein [Nocardia wallacei]